MFFLLLLTFVQCIGIDELSEYATNFSYYVDCFTDFLFESKPLYIKQISEFLDKFVPNIGHKFNEAITFFKSADFEHLDFTKISLAKILNTTENSNAGFFQLFFEFLTSPTLRFDPEFFGSDWESVRDFVNKYKVQLSNIFATMGAPKNRILDFFDKFVMGSQTVSDFYRAVDIEPVTFTNFLTSIYNLVYNQSYSLFEYFLTKVIYDSHNTYLVLLKNMHVFIGQGYFSYVDFNQYIKPNLETLVSLTLQLEKGYFTQFISEIGLSYKRVFLGTTFKERLKEIDANLEQIVDSIEDETDNLNESISYALFLGLNLITSVFSTEEFSISELLSDEVFKIDPSVINKTFEFLKTVTNNSPFWDILESIGEFIDARNNETEIAHFYIAQIRKIMRLLVNQSSTVNDYVVPLLHLFFDGDSEDDLKLLVSGIYNSFWKGDSAYSNEFMDTIFDIFYELLNITKEELFNALENLFVVNNMTLINQAEDDLKDQFRDKLNRLINGTQTADDISSSYTTSLYISNRIAGFAKLILSILQIAFSNFGLDLSKYIDSISDYIEYTNQYEDIPSTFPEVYKKFFHEDVIPYDANNITGNFIYELYGMPRISEYIYNHDKFVLRDFFETLFHTSFTPDNVEEYEEKYGFYFSSTTLYDFNPEFYLNFSSAVKTFSSYKISDVIQPLSSANATNTLSQLNKQIEKLETEIISVDDLGEIFYIIGAYFGLIDSELPDPPPISTSTWLIISGVCVLCFVLILISAILVRVFCGFASPSKDEEDAAQSDDVQHISLISENL